MKSFYKRIIIALLFVGTLELVFAAGNKNQYVSVQAAQVKAKPSQFAKTVAALKYGDEVSVVSVDKAWTKIKSLDGKAEGWLPASSLTTKKLIVKVKSEKKTSANATELALAGKGWSDGYESAIAKSSPKDYNYKAVDTVEAFASNDMDTIDFIKEGELFLGGQE